jgi:hypothetical protein
MNTSINGVSQISNTSHIDNYTFQRYISQSGNDGESHGGGSRRRERRETETEKEMIARTYTVLMIYH